MADMIQDPARNQGNILEVTRQMLPQLRKSDRKVAEAMLSLPERFMNATVAEAAAMAGVSQPTVIRFAASIGCGGFQDLKLRLAQALAFGTPATHSAIQDSDTADDVFGKIFDYTLTSLDWARKRIDRQRLEQAVELLSKASAIEFFGLGASGIVSSDAQQKFPLFGVPCGAAPDSHQQIMVASMMKPGQVAVVISNTGMTRSIVEVARLARENGAKVVGIVGAETSLTTYCDVAIVVETLENTNLYTPTISRIAALVVVDILSTCVAMRHGAAHRKKIADMKSRLSDMRIASSF